MKKEYVIISKTAIQKRIEELKKAQKKFSLTEAIWAFGKQELEKVLSQSTPLIPEIEKSYDQGYTDCEKGNNPDSIDYISNLKLDI